MQTFLQQTLADATIHVTDKEHAAKDLGVAKIAGALPYSLGPAFAPAIMAVGSYGALYSLAGVCALLGPPPSWP